MLTLAGSHDVQDHLNSHHGNGGSRRELEVVFPRYQYENRVPSCPPPVRCVLHTIFCTMVASKSCFHTYWASFATGPNKNIVRSMYRPTKEGNPVHILVTSRCVCVFFSLALCALCTVVYIVLQRLRAAFFSDRPFFAVLAVVCQMGC